MPCSYCFKPITHSALVWMQEEEERLAAEARKKEEEEEYQSWKV